MPRYIDADKVMDEINRIGGHNLCEWETIGVKALIDRQPTADVAPKSEVAILTGQVMALEAAKAGIQYASNKLLKQKILCDLGFATLAELRKEIAMEIFEEIEQLRLEFLKEKITGADLVAKLFLLKKKYTGEEKQ